MRDFGLAPHLRFGTEVTHPPPSTPRTGRWTLTTDAGESHEFDLLVTACGQLCRPAIPAIPGLEDFEGRLSTRPNGIMTTTWRAGTSP